MISFHITRSNSCERIKKIIRRLNLKDNHSATESITYKHLVLFLLQLSLLLPLLSPDVTDNRIMAFGLSRMGVAIAYFLSVAFLKGKQTTSFTNDSHARIPRRWRRMPAQIPSTTCQMVRNIDMVEALIFYGTASIFVDNPSGDSTNQAATRFLPGVDNLIEECKRDETAVFVILDDDDHGKDASRKCEDDDKNIIVFKTATSPPPNPLDLWEAIHSIDIQPKGFGGSSGFGRKAADPERSPSPAHCVVLCDTVDRCRAARFAGMRVLCLTDNELGKFIVMVLSSVRIERKSKVSRKRRTSILPYPTHNRELFRFPPADGVMNFGTESGETSDLESHWESINMDDIAMPGSFWLNPPFPRDDEGNGVDVGSLIEEYEKIENPSSTTDEESSDSNDSDDDDSRLAAILMDMDSL